MPPGGSTVCVLPMANKQAETGEENITGLDHFGTVPSVKFSG